MRKQMDIKTVKRARRWSHSLAGRELEETPMV